MPDNTEWLARDADVIAETMKIRFFPFVLHQQEGAVLTDVEGNQCIDFSAAWAVANTGNRHPTVIDRVNQGMKTAISNSALSIAHPPLIELAERLRDRVPGDFPQKVWFGHSGSEAGDLIWKILNSTDVGDTIVTFDGSYHGQTLGGATISGHSATGGNNTDKVITCDFPGTYSGVDSETTIDSVEHVLSTSNVAGVITEPIQSDAGIYDPPIGFLADLERLCRKHDTYFIIDETKSGLGRTGSFFAFERDDIMPDAVMIGKPLGSGLPISAVVGRQKLLDSLPAGHMMTTAGNPLSAAAGLGTLDAIKKDNLVERAELMGKKLRSMLDERIGDHDYVKDIRGRGLMLGLELSHPSGKPANVVTAKTVYRAHQLGLIVFYVGHNSNVLELTPPLTITEDELEMGVNRLAKALNDVQSGVVDNDEVASYQGW